MDMTPHSFKGDASVKGVFRRLLIDLNQLPEEEETIDLHEPPKDNMPAPLHLYVDLCFRNEDMPMLKQKYKVLGQSSAADSDDSNDLRYDGGCHTFMYVRDKRVQFPGKYLYALGRSLFKKGFTEKNKPQDVDNLKSLPKPLCASMVDVGKEGGKDKEKRNEDDAERLAAKELLQDFIKQAKARTRNSRKKGKKVERPTRSTCAPRSGRRKGKYFPKLRSVNALMSINNKRDP